MLIRWEDKDWPLSLDDLTNRQAMAMEAEMGMSLADFYEKFESDGDEKSVAAFDAAKPYFLKIMTIAYWLMLDQNGVKMKIADTEFPVFRFAQALIAGMAADAAAQPAANGEVKPDPTRPPGASARSRAPSSRSRKTRAVTAGSPDG